MKNRSPVEICAPLCVFALACLLSTPTAVIAIIWMSAGVCCLGYRALTDFRDERIPRAWHCGMRGACVYFYHLAWWPWYMRHELHAFVVRAQRGFAGKKPVAGGDSPENPDDPDRAP